MTDELPPLPGVSEPGQPSGAPAATPAELLTGFVHGRQQGAAGDWRVEGPLLIGRHTPLAIRLPEAALLRHEPGEDVDDLRRACARALAQAGLRCVEECTVLGHVIGIEVAALRDADWDLWATDPETGHAALRARALGELAERIDPEEPARRRREAQSLEEIERGLWP